jgi:D-glycero-alpha-D-manno-heptose-7-phosphate kinase
MLIVRTPVRVSFAGGGTDLPSYYERYGGVVLSTSIDKYFYTVLTERDDGQTQVISSDLRAVESCERIEKMEFQGSDLEIPFAVLKHLRCDAGVNLFLASEVPPGTGLGSSAAVCVKIGRAHV